MSEYTLRVADHDPAPLESFSWRENGFDVSRALDELSPYFAQYAANGTQLEVVLEGGGYTLELSNAYITSYSLGGESSESESISFDGEFKVD